MCGEHSLASGPLASLWGSSPHVRGARVAVALARQLFGIIPACAGSTWDLMDPVPFSQDHPRMCGEHGHGACQVTLHLGSSPHVRGAHFGMAPEEIFFRIIPACAGSTPW